MLLKQKQQMQATMETQQIVGGDDQQQQLQNVQEQVQIMASQVDRGAFGEKIESVLEI